MSRPESAPVRKDALSTTTSAWVRTLAQLIEGQGIAPGPLFEEVGLELARVNTPRYRVPQSGLSRLWSRLVELTGNPAIGLSLGERVSPATFGAIGFAMLSSATLGEALQVGLTHQQDLADASHCSLLDKGPELAIRVEHRGEQGPSRIPIIEAMISAIMAYARWMTRADLPFLGVEFQHQPQAPDEIYQRTLGCAVTFGAPENIIRCGPGLLAEPMPAHDPVLRDYHLSLAAEFRLQSRQTYTARVTGLIFELLPEGDVGLESIAGLLHVSPKTLQRRLKEEGYRFRDAVEAARTELAQRYLQNADYPLSEVAGLCGYSDYSAFAKAFQKHCGQTPHRWREGKDPVTRLS